MPHSTFHQLERLFQILHLIQTRPPGKSLSRSDLARACECDMRTIQRDINLLRRNAQIDFIYDRHEKAYTLTEKGLPYFAPSFDFTDTLALALVGSVVTASPAFPQRAAILMALGKVNCILKPPLRRLLQDAVAAFGVPELPRNYAAAPISLLVQATASRRTVLLDYTSYSGRGRTWRRVDPYQVEAREGIFWELHGWCHENRAIRTFALDHRLHEAHQTEESFLRREADWDVFCRDRGVGGLRGGNEPTEVDVLFSPEAAPYALVNGWPRGLTVTEVTDSSDIDTTARRRVRLSGTVTGGVDALITELLRWRRHAHVLGGASLRERLTAEITAMATLYAPSPTDAEKTSHSVE